MPKADDILTVLAGEPIELDNLKFSVITDAADDRSGSRPGDPSFWPFSKGEIIVNDGEGGREPFGEGRKPAKWSVHEEAFDTLAEAQDCSRKVLAGEWPRAFQHGFAARANDSTLCRACEFSANHGIHMHRVDDEWVAI